MFGKSSDDQVIIESGSEDETMREKGTVNLQIQLTSSLALGMAGRDIRFNKVLLFYIFVF